jgi:alkylation response protein AidB-like acyl-CoA dehydrogenase
MEFCFSPEQEQFRESLARFLRDRAPTTATRKLMDTEAGYDPAVWRQLCGELGLAGLHLPEEVGGSGYGPVELGIAMEEQGRALLCAPYLASAVMAGYALLLGANDTQQTEYLPGIADGSTIAALAVNESAALWSPNDIRLTATRDGGGFRLDGRKRFVVDGLNAGLLVVAGRIGAGISLFAVEAGAEGITRNTMAPMDATRRLAEIHFSGTPARLLGTEGGAPLQTILDAVLVALAHEMIGGAQALLDSAVAYAKLRVQFGRPIGSFQAIKHRCADLLVQVELAKAAVYQAAQLMADDADRDDVTLAASRAKAVASEAYMLAARECIQFHGGIGFTWENDTHLWFKRAKSSEVFLGTPREHRERMLQAMGV